MSRKVGFEVLHDRFGLRMLKVCTSSDQGLCFSLLLAAALWVLPLNLQAGDWQTGANLNVSEVYTDNVCLETQNTSSESITTLTPSVAIKGEGRRVSLDMDAALELNSLKSDGSICRESERGERDSSNPRLRADAGLELLKNFLFVDLSSRVQQNKVDPFRSGGDSSLNRSDNINTTYTYQASPYLTTKLGDWARLNLRYSFNGQKNSRDSVDDSDQKTLTASLKDSSGRFSWSLDANQQQVDYNQQSNENVDDKLASANLTLGYQVDSMWQLNASSGQDFNDYTSVDDEIDGQRWRAGLRWTPNPRTELNLGFGNRFFGNTPELTFTHHRRRSEISVNYAHTLVYTRDLRIDEVLLPVLDSSGTPLQSQLGEPVFIAFNQTIVSRSPVVDERLQLAYRLQGRVSVLNLSAQHSKQIREEDNESSRFSRYQVSFDRRLARNISINSRLTLSERKADYLSGSPVDDSKTWRLYLGLVRQFNHYTQVSLNYAYTERQAELAGDNYTENRVTVSFGFAL